MLCHPLTQTRIPVWIETRVYPQATSAVTGFEEAADKFEADMKAAGVTLATTTDFVPA